MSGLAKWRRGAPPLFLLALALLATAFAADLPDSADPVPAPPATPPIAVSLTVEVAAIRRAIGPDLSRLALEAAASALARPKASLDAWLCAAMRQGTGFADSCPAGGAVLSAPDSQPVCTVHGTSSRLQTPDSRLQTPDSRLQSALGAVDALTAYAYLDGETLRPLSDRGELELSLAPGTGALDRLGLAGSDVTEASVDGPGAGRLRLRVTRGRERLGVRWAPADASATTTAAIAAPPPDLVRSSAVSPIATAEPVLARVDIPIGVPMWRVFEARIPGNVGLGRPPISMAIVVRASGIQVRVRHFSEAAVLNLDSNLATGLSVLKVATAFKRRGHIDQVFEYLFRAPRRQESDELVIEGPWPPDLKGGVAQAVDNATRSDATSPALAAALCRIRRLTLERALASWESERGAAFSGPLDRLVAEGFVDRLPTCPDGPALTADDGQATCRTHAIPSTL